VQCIFLKNYTDSLQYAPPPYPGFRGCFVTKANDVLWANYTATAVVEAVVLGLMVTSAFQSYRRGNNSELLHIVHRDGIQFDLYLLCISVGNVLIMRALPFEDTVLLPFLQSMIYPVLTARIVLNIRDVGNLQGVHTELHTVYQPTMVFAVPLGPIPEQESEDDHICDHESPMRWQRANDNEKAVA